MPTIYWNTHGILLPGNQAGIGIAEDSSGRIANFQQRVVADLATLNAIVPSGQALIASIIGGINTGKRLGIVAPRIWTRGWGANECAALGGGNARTHVAEALGSGADHTITNALKLKLNTIGRHRDWAWLCSQIRNTPRYRLQGPVAVAASNIGLLALDLERWVEHTRPLFVPISGVDLNDIKNAIMIFLDSPAGVQLVNGGGSSSRVYYDPRKNFSQLGPRPAYIGLAHEMVHHYYNARGAQLSHSEDSSHLSTVLYEYMCVGLGPWVAAAISENRIRADDGVALRRQYA